jgi:hypothetical protein
MSHRRTFAIILALAVIVGLPNLPRPMHGDQVLFLLGAESIERGDLLYRDFWDVKQPGVFAYYWLGGKVFGFNEIGIHLFELLCWLAFAWFVAQTWPRMIGEEGPSVWPAFTTAGWYWAVTGGVQQTQVESLVGPLLYLHLWLLLSTRLKTSGWLLAGVVAASVLMLKLMFLPLLCIAVLFAAIRIRRQRGWRALPRLVVGYTFAMSVSVLVCLLPWIIAGEMEQVWRTFFDYPSQMLQEVPPAHPRRLAEAALWFVTRYGSLLAISLLGVIHLWKSGRREWVIFALAWIVLGLGIIVIQRLSWWSYHFMLLAIPVGLLAASGCMAAVKSGSRIRIAIVMLVLTPAIFATVLKWRDVVRSSEDHADQIAREETAFLRDGSSLPGPIYVAGEPIYYRKANRRQTVPIHGWSLELYPAEIRIKLAKQLIHAEPAYIFVDRVLYAQMIDDRYPEIAVLLRDYYKVLRRSDAGTWYERRE